MDRDVPSPIIIHSSRLAGRRPCHEIRESAPDNDGRYH